MNAAIAIRHGELRDRAFVLDLGRRTVETSVSPLRSTTLPIVELAFERLAEYVFDQPHVVLIAHACERSVGFLLLLDSLPDEVTMAPQGFVAYMAVEADVRRSGVGRALIGAAEREARERGLPHLSLMVTEGNAEAAGLYAQVGFKTERRLLTKTLA